MIAIRLETPGSPIYKQKRIGRNGVPFMLCKLRSMREGKESRITDSVRLRDKEQSRVTHIGRFIRKWKIDELPQLYNILRGEMAFVGPRPQPVQVARKAEHYCPEKDGILPGLTGLPQISMLRKSDGYRTGRLDRFYAKRKCLLFDLRISLSTALFLFSKKNSDACT